MPFSFRQITPNIQMLINIGYLIINFSVLLYFLFFFFSFFIYLLPLTVNKDVYLPDIFILVMHISSAMQ